MIIEAAPPNYDDEKHEPAPKAVPEPKHEPDIYVDDNAPRGRRDLYDAALRLAQAQANNTTRSTPPGESDEHGTVAAVDNDKEPRPRDSEPVRDTVQEDADRMYREMKLERQNAEQEIRSRSASPEPSVVGKWNEEVEDPVVRIVTPPEMKRPPKKSKYDGPNADVRVDNFILPRDLHRYKAPASPIAGLKLVPVFKSRDPSCDGERPMLNVVMPTPRSTPSPEKQQERQGPIPAPEEEKKAEEIKPSDGPKSVSWGENDTRRFDTQSPEPSQEKLQENRNAIQASALAKLGKTGPKKISWATIFNAARAAPGSASGSDKPARIEQDKPRGPEPESTPKGPEPTPTVSPVLQSMPSRIKTNNLAKLVAQAKQKAAEAEAASEPEPAPVETRKTPPSSPKVMTDLDDMPPPVGPKPASPSRSHFDSSVLSESTEKSVPGLVRDETKETPTSPPRAVSRDLDEVPQPPSPPPGQTSGSFGDDLEFAAAVAAGLESTGFNPDIVIDDPTYRRRNSPPGSNESSFYVPPSAETVTDLGVDTQPSYSGPRDMETDIPTDKWDTLTKLERNRGRGKQDKSTKRQDSIDTDIRSEALSVVEKVSRDVELAQDDEVQPKLTKKEHKKRDKEKAKSLTQEEDIYAPPESQSTVSVDAGDEDWDNTPSKKGKKPKKSKQPAISRADDVPESSKSADVTPAPEPEDEWAPMDKKSKKRSSKRDPMTSESSATYSTPSSEVSIASSGSKRSKKSRRSSTKDDYDIPEQEEPPDRPGDSFQIIDRDVGSIKSNGSHVGDADDAKSVKSITSVRSKKSSKHDDGESSFELVTPTNGTFEHAESSINENGGNQDSFLASAGTFGAGVGPAGAAVAIATEPSRPNATQDFAMEETRLQRERSVSYGSQVVDPEIVERAIKPAIDPQFGDLLPLPPSEPGSPSPLLDDDFPTLPESRPDTPPEERNTRPKTHTRNRSSIVETPKTPSRTAVPLQFRLGRGSVPSSPGFLGRSSPGMSPILSCEMGLETPPSTRRPRPMSWEGSREIKPLYLIEKTSSSTLGAEFQPDDLPELPPSGPPSRGSPGPELRTGDDDLDYPNVGLGFSHRLESLRDLRVDTQLPISPEHDLLGSQEVTPKAGMPPALLLEALPVVKDASNLPAPPESRGSSIAGDPVDSVAAEVSMEPAELVPTALPPQSLDESVTSLPALPESRSNSVVRPAVETAVSEPVQQADVVSDLPDIKESRSSSIPRASTETMVTESHTEPTETAAQKSPEQKPTEEVVPVSVFSRSLDEDVSVLPALPESRSSSIARPVVETEVPSPRQASEQDVSDLPALPESRSSSISRPLFETVAAEILPEPTVKEIVPDPVLSRSLQEDVSDLPPLPESRSSSI
ncbi:hypothetical protein B0H67DRAFT_606340, partial [Lasiosphaeris hirsuta]